MLAMYAAGWPSALEDSVGAHDRIHRVALDEARIATDWHSRGGANVRALGLVDRVRRAIGIAPAQADCIACAA